MREARRRVALHAGHVVAAGERDGGAETSAPWFQLVSPARWQDSHAAREARLRVIGAARGVVFRAVTADAVRGGALVDVALREGRLTCGARGRPAATTSSEGRCGRHLWYLHLERRSGGGRAAPETTSPTARVSTPYACGTATPTVRCPRTSTTRCGTVRAASRRATPQARRSRSTTSSRAIAGLLGPVAFFESDGPGEFHPYSSNNVWSDATAADSLRNCAHGQTPVQTFRDVNSGDLRLSGTVPDIGFGIYFRLDLNLPCARRD